jgi:hypothetical protein
MQKCEWSQGSKRLWYAWASGTRFCCVPLLCYTENSSGRGAAWLARLLGVQEVPGSNPGGPTI